MTLGTSDHVSVWTAPVYYIYHDMEFYFFSNSSSRHIQESEKFIKISASIHHNPKEWNDIKGIQMEGIVSKAKKGKKSVEAFKLYIKRFAFAKKIANKPISGSLDCFKEQFKVKWYKFIPEKIIYLDNSIRFGFKLRLLPNLEVCK